MLSNNQQINFVVVVNTTCKNCQWIQILSLTILQICKHYLQKLILGLRHFQASPFIINLKKNEEINVKKPVKINVKKAFSKYF